MDGESGSGVGGGGSSDSGMPQAVHTVASYHQMLNEQPLLHKKAMAHVKKHGHAKAMDALPNKPIKSMDDLKKAAASISSPETTGDYTGGGGS